MSKLVEVTQEDANNYCRMLTALGMEEEGDPVAAVETLRAERGAAIREAHENKQRAMAFERDAVRYRKVRRGQHWSVIDGIGDPLRGDVLDAAVDAVPAVG